MTEPQRNGGRDEDDGGVNNLSKFLSNPSVGYAASSPTGAPSNTLKQIVQGASSSRRQADAILCVLPNLPTTESACHTLNQIVQGASSSRRQADAILCVLPNLPTTESACHTLNQIVQGASSSRRQADAILCVLLGLSTPKSACHGQFYSWLRMILPLIVFGNSSLNTTILGYL